MLLLWNHFCVGVIVCFEVLFLAVLTLILILIATAKTVTSNASRITKANLILLAAERVVKIVVINGATTITIVFNKPTLEAKIFLSKVASIFLLML